jgi:hypothetical protein
MTTMNATNQIITPACRRRLQTQGYMNFSDDELLAHRFGIRFAYWVCVTAASVGIIAGSAPIILAVATLALVASFPPHHPVDYLYNYVIRHVLKRPKLPPRSNQGRFACGIASVWLVMTAYLFANNEPIIATTVGLSLVAIGLLVSTTDICIPSMLYNFLFISKKPKTI